MLRMRWRWEIGRARGGRQRGDARRDRVETGGLGVSRGNRRRDRVKTGGLGPSAHTGTFGGLADVPAHRERRRRRRVVDLDGEEEVDEEPAGLLTNAGPPMIKDNRSLGANVVAMRSKSATCS